jgi:hypothetical protein
MKPSPAAAGGADTSDVDTINGVGYFRAMDIIKTDERVEEILA